jgi:hypothetical protein
MASGPRHVAARRRLMRWVVWLAVLSVAVILWLCLNRPSENLEDRVVPDGIASNPECFDLIVRVARRERAILEAIRRGEKPIGLKCSNVDIVRAMKSEGGRINRHTGGRTLDFDIRSKERWLFARRSRLGFYQTDRIFFVRDDDGAITHVTWAFPYIT